MLYVVTWLLIHKQVLISLTDSIWRNGNYKRLAGNAFDHVSKKSVVRIFHHHYSHYFTFY